MHKSTFYFSMLALPAMITACGGPPTIEHPDRAEAVFGAGMNPVALVEVKNTNADSSAGLSLRSSLHENTYCTGFVLENGNVLTDGNCVAGKSDGSGIAESENITIYLRSPKEKSTNQYKVTRVAEVRREPSANYAELVTAEASTLPKIYGFIPVATSTPDVATLRNNIEAKIVKLDNPNDKGQAEMSVASVTIKTGAVFDHEEAIFSSDLREKEKDIKDDEVRKRFSESRAPELKDRFAMPQKFEFVVEKIGRGNSGAPIVANGQCLALVHNAHSFTKKDGDEESSSLFLRKGSADTTAEPRAQWLIGRTKK